MSCKSEYQLTKEKGFTVFKTEPKDSCKHKIERCLTSSAQIVATQLRVYDTSVFRTAGFKFVIFHNFKIYFMH